MLTANQTRSNRPLTILVVDDEDGIRKMMVEAIRTFYPEFRVAEAIDGLQAASLVRSRKPALVITDIQMPHMDGYGLCDLISHEYRDTPPAIVAITGDRSRDAKEIAARCRANCCLRKPFDLDQLFQAIHCALPWTPQSSMAAGA
jgi:CheY-like chemotaxis protein